MTSTPTNAHTAPSPDTPGSAAAPRGWSARLTSAVSAAVGAVAGLAPHVLHHIGPLAGAALVSGGAGSALFGALGFVLTVPMLLRLRRRFGSWLAPGIAVVLFGVMFTVSTVWIGPAVRGAGEATNVTQPVDEHGH